MPERELFRKDTEKWMKKHDYLSYQVWKNLLKPNLGKSIAKTESAIKHLRRFNSRRRFASHSDVTIERIVKLMRNSRSRYYAESYPHAYITFGFLHRLVLHHRRRLLLSRQSIRS